MGWKGLIYSNFFLLSKISNDSQLMVVLEDDCKLLDTLDIFKTRFMQYIEFLNLHMGEWDLFSGGGIYIRPTKIISTDPFIIECAWSVCTQFIIHSPQSANDVIRLARNPREWKYSIDTYLATTFKRIWLPYPMLCIQEVGDSDINQRRDYKNRIDNGFKEAIIILDNFVKNNLSQYNTKTNI